MQTDGADFKLGKRKRDPSSNGGEPSTPAKSPPKKRIKTEMKEEPEEEVEGELIFL